MTRPSAVGSLALSGVVLILVAAEGVRLKSAGNCRLCVTRGLLTRPVKAYPREVTREQIATLGDAELEELFIDYVLGRLDEVRYRNADRIVAELPRGLQYAWHVSGIEFEVPNGGFQQFFFNSTGPFALDTREALVAFGAHERVALLDDALGYYERQLNRPRDSRERYPDLLIESEFLEKLNKAYWKTQDEKPVAIAAYARSHPDEFIHPAR